MEITVERSDFKPSPGENAPRGSTTISFESMIRVRNGETILLGGLEVKSKSNSGSGLPVLSRIPVLKWFFSNRTRATQDAKLHILITPTIIY
ncbi:MAG: hypothetical protein JKY53_11840 [Flavobacteriales bacterium]|nr:hypothetical protein [Flavobacteriales bacterium]